MDASHPSACLGCSGCGFWAQGLREPLAGAALGGGAPWRHLSAQGGAQAVVECQDAVGAHHLQRHACHAQLHLLLRLQVHLWGEGTHLLSGQPAPPAACSAKSLSTAFTPPRRPWGTRATTSPLGDGKWSTWQRPPKGPQLGWCWGAMPCLAPTSAPHCCFTSDNTRRLACPPGLRETLRTYLSIWAPAVGGDRRPHFTGEELGQDPNRATPKTHCSALLTSQGTKSWGLRGVLKTMGDGQRQAGTQRGEGESPPQTVTPCWARSGRSLVSAAVPLGVL